MWSRKYYTSIEKCDEIIRGLITYKFFLQSRKFYQNYFARNRKFCVLNPLKIYKEFCRFSFVDTDKKKLMVTTLSFQWGIPRLELWIGELCARPFCILFILFLNLFIFSTGKIAFLLMSKLSVQLGRVNMQIKRQGICVLNVGNKTISFSFYYLTISGKVKWRLPPDVYIRRGKSGRLDPYYTSIVDVI